MPEELDRGNGATGCAHLSLLYRFSAVAALLMVALTAFDIVVYITSPPPGTVAGHIHLFQTNPLAALVALDLPLVVIQALEIPLTLALYFALRRYSPALIALSVGLSFVAIVAFIVTRPALEMMQLSQQFASAATEAQKAAALAAGQALMAAFRGTAFHTSYLLGTAAGIVVSAVMLHSPEFGKVTAWVGLVAAISGLGLYVPLVGWPLAVLSALVLQVWNVLIARTLWRLGRCRVPAS